MTYLATSGTHSCAAMSIAGFKESDITLNDKYLKDPDKFELSSEGKSVYDFYKEVLNPLSQPLGKTKNYPFDLLMKEIAEAPHLEGKLMFVILNEYQVGRGYWPKKLKEHGFKLTDKTDNKGMGDICYFYTRNYNRPEYYNQGA